MYSRLYVLLRRVWQNIWFVNQAQKNTRKAKIRTANLKLLKFKKNSIVCVEILNNLKSSQAVCLRLIFKEIFTGITMVFCDVSSINSLTFDHKLQTNFLISSQLPKTYSDLGINLHLGIINLWQELNERMCQKQK